MYPRITILGLAIALVGCEPAEPPPLYVVAETLEWRTEGGGHLSFDVRREGSSAFMIHVIEKDFRPLDASVALDRQASVPIFDLLERLFDGKLNLSGQTLVERQPTGTWTKVYVVDHDQRRYQVTSSHVIGELRDLRYWIESQLTAAPAGSKRETVQTGDGAEEPAAADKAATLSTAPWKELVELRQRLDLPGPPPAAPLMALLYEMEAIEDRDLVLPLHRPRYLLGFLVTAEKPAETTRLLVGTELLPLSAEQVEWLRPVKPEEDLPGQIVMENAWVDFPIDALLPTAILCYERGWHDLADRLMREHAQAAKGCGDPQSLFYQPPGSPPALSMQWIAWAHAGNLLAAPQSDRPALLKRFQALSDGASVLKTPEHRAFVQALAATVEPGPAPADAVARQIDGWTELDAGLWGDSFMLGLPPELLAVARQGWQAVPALIEHLDDRRLTRSVNRPLTGPRHLATVGEIASLLLRAMAGDAGLNWQRDAQGLVAVDEVRAWWLKVQQMSEADYLAGAAIPESPDATRTYLPIIERLAVRYPQQLGEVYRRLLTDRPDVRSSDLVAAIVACNLGTREKIDLLYEGAGHSRLARQAEALEGLATLDPPLHERLLMRALEAMPATTPGLFAECEQVALSQQCWNTNSRDVWHALRDALRRADVGIRMEVIGQIGNRTDLNTYRQRRVAELLLALMDDASVRDIAASPDKYHYADGSQWPTLEVRNWAAYQLGRQWGFDLDPVVPAEESPEAWQRLRGDLVQRAEELRYLPEPPTYDEQRRAREALQQAGVVLLEPHPDEPLERRANLAFSEIKDADLRHFRYLPEIEVIGLTGTAITDAGLKELAVCQGLVSLELNDTKITDAGLRHLAKLPRLARLNLSSTAVTSAGLEELTSLEALTDLDLGMTAVSDDGLSSLSKLPRLAQLDLTNTAVTDAGMKHLAAIPRLQSLDLLGTVVSDAGLEGLAECRELESLALTFTKVTDDGIKHLAKLPKLRRLFLYGLPLTDRGMQELARLRTLTTLSITSPQVTDAGVQALAELSQLEELYVAGSGLSDAGMASLATLKRIRRLDVGDTAITDRSIDSLVALETLERVVLAGTKITDAGKEKLRAARPTLQIVDDTQ